MELQAQEARRRQGLPARLDAVRLRLRRRLDVHLLLLPLEDLLQGAQVALLLQAILQADHLAVTAGQSLRQRLRQFALALQAADLAQQAPLRLAQAKKVGRPAVRDNNNVYQEIQPLWPLLVAMLR